MTTEMPFKSNDFPPQGQARPDVASTALAGLSTDDGAAGGSEQVARDTLARLRREGPDHNWTIVQRVDDTDPVRANRQALEDLAEGATGLSLVFEGAPNAFGFGLPATPEALETVLEGVALDTAYLRVDVHPASRAVADWLVDLLTRRRADPSRLKLSFGIDPAASFAGSGRLRMSIEALQASMPQSLAHFFGLGVPGVLLEADGRVYHNAGATEAQELGAMVAAAVAHLRLFEDARQALIYAAPHIGFALSCDHDQHLSVAKIRALRKLWSKVLQESAVPPSSAVIHAETSFRATARMDPETNIARSTLACLAAAAGGADSISILPHTIAHGLPDARARRVARNTQLVMATEARVDLVADSISGSSQLDALAEALREAAWAEFRVIESEGGILASLAAGRLQTRVLAARDERAAQVRSGERTIVGATVYPPTAGSTPETLDAEDRPEANEGAVFCQRLEPSRLDESFAGS